MRTVTFSDNRVQRVLNHDFVCCYTDTTGDPTAGASFHHAPGEQPGPCGRGAGRQNVQVVFLTPKSEIFHVATGYLGPDDLLAESAYALQLFDRLQHHGPNRKQTVADSHRLRLKKLGFKPDEIAASDNALTDVLLSGLSPQDFGINMPTAKDFGVSIPGAGSTVFQDIGRQRILKDHQFVICNPLIARKQFEGNPQSLVGRHKSFFGSNAAMNGLTNLRNR